MLEEHGAGVLGGYAGAAGGGVLSWHGGCAGAGDGGALSYGGSRGRSIGARAAARRCRWWPPLPRSMGFTRIRGGDCPAAWLWQGWAWLLGVGNGSWGGGLGSTAVRAWTIVVAGEGGSGAACSDLIPADSTFLRGMRICGGCR